MDSKWVFISELRLIETIIQIFVRCFISQNLDESSQEHFNRLIEHLRSSNEDEFLEEINSVADRDQRKKFFSKVDNSDTLLILAVKNGLLNAVGKLLELGADVNASNQAQHPLTPLKAACIFGKSETLKLRDSARTARIGFEKCWIICVDCGKKLRW